MQYRNVFLGLFVALVLLGGAYRTVEAHPTTFSMPAEDQFNGCDNPQSCLYPHWEPRYFWQCTQAGTCKATSCPDGLFWNQQRRTCDHLASRTTKQAAMTTSAARFNAKKRQILGLSADIGLIGEKVTFRTRSGALLCSATTGANGIAKCDSPVGLKGNVASLTAGFVATYEGNNPKQFAAKKANGEIKKIDE